MKKDKGSSIVTEILDNVICSPSDEMKNFGTIDYFLWIF